MNSTKKIVIIFCGIFLVSIIGMAITFGIGGRNFLQANRFEISESKNLDLSGVNKIKIQANSSDIHIVPSDVAKVELKGMIVPFEHRESYLSVGQRDGLLLINIEDDTWQFFNFLSIFEDIDLTVYLPADCMLDVEVHCTSGDIDMAGMKLGNVELWRTSGNTDIRDCSAESFVSDASSGDTRIESSSLGSTKLTCRSGNITINGTTGSIYVRATSGDIDIADASGALDVGCTSGNVTIDVGDTVQPITAELTSGNISIYMPSSAAFNLEARTTSGNIESDFSIAVSGSLNHSFVGENISGICNGGGPLVSAAVTSGNINLFAK